MDDIVSLDEGSDVMQQGIEILRDILEGGQDEEPLFVIPSLREKQGELLLKELVRSWANYKVMICWLSHFFDHLDDHFVRMNCIPPLREVALTSFLDLVYEEVKSKVRDVVIVLINQEREGGRIDRALLRNVLDVFVVIGEGKMNFYENDFEDAMLENTDAYYSQKASKWIVECSCHDYMLKTWECVVREHKRVAHYLHHSSGRKLFESVVYKLCRVYKSQLLDGFRVMLRHNEVKILKMMYLFSFFVWDSGQMENIFQQHVTSEGIALVQQADDAAGYKVQEFVRNVIELHDKYFGHVIYCFSNEFTFSKALKDAFEVFCNKPVMAELLAPYCDDILKKGGSEKLGDEALEETLLKVIMLLSYVSDKDLFAELYRMKLSYRLLFERNVNYDHERLFLAKFKQKFDSQFTSKMEGMVTDLSLAREMQNQFQEYLNSNKTSNPGIEMFVSVLTTGLWPSYKSSDLILPADLAKCVEVFDEFYKTKTKERKLNWIYSLGTCQINVKFEQKMIELILGTCQAAVLLLFNDANKLSYSDIKTRLNLADDDLIGLLHSLSCSKYKILNKDPETGSVSINDNFEFNSKFTAGMGRIRIPRPALIDEREKMFQDLDRNRRCATDAVIVLIMKYRKVLSHQELVTECIHQLSHMFKPDVELIDNRIQHLITLHYLERDNENPENFRFLVEDADC